MYLDKVCDICTNQYSSQLLTPVLQKWQALIRPALLLDSNALGSIQGFDLSLTTDMDNAYNFTNSNAGFNIKIPALLPYISTQRTWAVNQIKKQEGYCALADVSPSQYEMELKPNPATDLIHLSWKQDATASYRLLVYNVYGEIVLATEWIVNDTKEETLNISKLPRGFYILRKQDADGFWSDAKFIKRQIK